MSKMAPSSQLTYKILHNICQLLVYNTFCSQFDTTLASNSQTITRRSRHKLSFVAYLSIPVLIYRVNKIPQTLDLPFYLRFKCYRAIRYSLRVFLIFQEIISLGSLNSLVSSNWGVLLHQQIMTGESLFQGVNIQGDTGPYKKVLI